MDFDSAPRTYVPHAQTAERMPRVRVRRARRSFRFDLSDLWDNLPIAVVALSLGALQICAFCGVFGPTPW